MIGSRLGHQSLSVLVSRFAGAAAQYALFLVLTRTLGVAETGRFSQALAVWTVIGSLSILGLNLGVTRFVAGPRGLGDSRGVAEAACSALGVSTMTVTAAAAALYFGGAGIAQLFAKPEMEGLLRIAAVGLPMFPLLWVGAGILQGLGKSATASWLRDVVWFLLIVFVLLALHWSYWEQNISSAWAIPIASAVVGGMIVFECSRQVSFTCSPSTILRGGVTKTLLRFSAPLGLAAVLATVGQQYADIIVAGYYLSDSDVGLYTVAVRTVRAAQVTMMASLIVFGPIAASLYVTRQISELGKVYRSMAGWAWMIGAPIGVFMLVRPAMLLGLFGRQMDPAVPLVRVLVAGQLVNLLTGPAGHLLIMTDRQMVEAWNNGISAAGLVGLAILLTPTYGTLGIAIAASASMGLVNILRVIQGWRLVGLHPFSGSMLKTSIALVFAGVGLWSIPMPTWTLLPRLGEQLILFVALYVTGVLLVGMSPEDRTIIMSMTREGNSSRED